MAEPSGWGAVGYGIAGGFANDRENKRKEIQLKAAEQGLQYDKSGNLQPAAWSEKSADQMSIEALTQQVNQLKNSKIQENTWNTFDDSVTSGNWENTNKYINSPDAKPLFTQMNVGSIEKFNPDNEAHLGLLKSSGANIDVVNALAKAKEDGIVTQEELQAIQAAYPVVRGVDGSLSISSVEQMSILTGRAKSTYNTKNYDTIQDTIVKGKQALKGITGRLYDAKVQAAEISNTGDQLKLDMLQRMVDENPNLSAADMINALNNKTVKGETAPGEEKKPYDVQTAEYFGSIKSKIDSGEATPEETATYNSWLTSKGGSNAAMSEKVANDVSKLEKKGIDLSSPEFSLDNLTGKDKAEATVAIRNLENTIGGKKLVGNIAAKLGDGLGAVKTTASKLESLVTDKNVSTAIVKEQINQVKSYLPEALQEMSDADLNDAEFRQAYLSAASVFLKLQSGLTVSEAEAARFATSFGTLNKNTKVNMIGLKTKLDEVISDYESNSVLEPTLYNAKYRKPIDSMKQTSKNLESFVNKPAPKSTNNYLDGQTAINPSTGELLTFRAGKGWVKE